MTWTTDELRNAYRYGVCAECGTPRVAHYMSETTPEGKVHAHVTIICPSCSPLVKKRA